MVTQPLLFKAADAILGIKDRYVTLPDAATSAKIVEEIEEDSGFPNCLGE